jgi:phosphatidylinositol alpha 1,6-mannosyltransferase
MDLFAFPSRTDTFGNVVLEALSSGVPALVSGGGGPKHIVQHGKTGFVAESDEEFTGYVQYAFKNRHRLRRMGSEARSYAKRQDWDAVFHRVFSAYETCLAAKSRDFNSELRRDPVLLRKSAP